MIRVYRPNEPPGFLQQRALWEKEFQEEISKSTPVSTIEVWRKIRSRKAMQEYARLLFLAFQYKCAFCESKPVPVSHLHIEHYRPKSTTAFQNYIFDWNNWLVACMTCNGNKGEYFADCENEPCLLDPTVEDPGAHVHFLRAQIVPKTERGKRTIDQIKLDRSELEDARASWLLLIESLLLLALHVSEAKKQARELLIWAMQDDAPYAAMVRSYLHGCAPKLANPATPHPVVQLDEPNRKLTDILSKYNKELQDLE